MKSQGDWKSSGWAWSLVFLAACSTSNKLRKFDEGDITKEAPADFGKRFEVKDLASATPSPAPDTEKKAPQKVKKTKKVKESPQPSVDMKSPPPSRRITPMPFEVGEKLNYDLRFVGVTAATFKMEVLPVKLVDDHKVYEIAARAKTVKLFELVYRVDDRIQSFFDYEGIYTHRFSIDLDETKQNRKVLELYDYQKNQSFYWNRIDHVEKGLKEEKETHDIQPWSHDPLTMLYYLRVAPLPVDSSTEVRIPVVVDGKPWETVVRYLRTETIFAGGKTREARVYHLENYMGKELKNKDNTLWLSTDEHRYILRVETKLKVGSFAVALDQIL
jgi:hypothetical protein